VHDIGQYKYLSLCFISGIHKIKKLWGENSTKNMEAIAISYLIDN